VNNTGTKKDFIMK